MGETAGAWLRPTRNRAGDGGHADDAAALQVVEARDLDAYFKSEVVGVVVFGAGHALGRVDQYRATELGCPAAILDVLVTVDDQPGPRLANAQGFHAAPPKRALASLQVSVRVWQMPQFGQCALSLVLVASSPVWVKREQP